MTTITALHTLQDGKIVTMLGNLPGPDDGLTRDELADLAQQILSAAYDNHRLSLAPMRDPMTPGYFEYPAIEGGTHD